jgi:hypothetical protein
MRTRHMSAFIAPLAMLIAPLTSDVTLQGTPEGEMVSAWEEGTCSRLTSPWPVFGCG